MLDLENGFKDIVIFKFDPWIEKMPQAPICVRFVKKQNKRNPLYFSKET